jgi:3-deoxy-D-manno-octulosonic acid kinase
MPRPFNELRIAATLRDYAIATPRVTAACVYPCRFLYRGEVAREEVPQARDLAACLFGERALVGRARANALTASGRLVAQLHAASIYHPDLNLRNILIAEPERRPHALIIDLEKCRMQGRLSATQRARMLARLERSAARMGSATGSRLTAADWKSFHAGYSELVG